MPFRYAWEENKQRDHFYSKLIPISISLGQICKISHEGMPPDPFRYSLWLLFLTIQLYMQMSLLAPSRSTLYVILVTIGNLKITDHTFLNHVSHCYVEYDYISYFLQENYFRMQEHITFLHMHAFKCIQLMA